VRTWSQSAYLRDAVTAAGELLSDEALDARRAGIRAVAQTLEQCKTDADERAALEALRDPDKRACVFNAAVAFTKAAGAHSEREQWAIYRKAAASASVTLTITETIIGPDGTSVDWDVTEPDPVDG
jgi:hypothetical protein